MTIDEAIREIQGKYGGTARASVEYAQKQIQAEEKVFAAFTANIHTRHGHFPGVVALTDRRIFAACGLPGISRLVECPLREITRCQESKSPLTYTVSFGTARESFQATITSNAGKNFASYTAGIRHLVDVRRSGRNS